jgi:hypothetical protein
VGVVVVNNCKNVKAIIIIIIIIIISYHRLLFSRTIGASTNQVSLQV